MMQSFFENQGNDMKLNKFASSIIALFFLASCTLSPSPTSSQTPTSPPETISDPAAVLLAKSGTELSLTRSTPRMESLFS